MKSCPLFRKSIPLFSFLALFAGSTTAHATPDFIPMGVRIDASSVYIEYMNIGTSGGGSARYASKIKYLANNQSYELPPTIVPGPINYEEETDPIARTSLGLASCAPGTFLNFQVTVDSTNLITELDETNNVDTYQVACPDTAVCPPVEENVCARGQQASAYSQVPYGCYYHTYIDTTATTQAACATAVATDLNFTPYAACINKYRNLGDALDLKYNNQWGTVVLSQNECAPLTSFPLCSSVISVSRNSFCRCPAGSTFPAVGCPPSAAKPFCTTLSMTPDCN